MNSIKIIHISCVVLSFSGFFIRGIWMLSDSVLLAKKSVKTLPHIIDTLLLMSAFVLLYNSQWSFLEHQWLQAKVIALLIYIFLGFIAMKDGLPKINRGLAWGAGLMVFLYIVSVALSKSVLGFIGWFYI